MVKKDHDDWEAAVKESATPAAVTHWRRHLEELIKICVNIKIWEQNNNIANDDGFKKQFREQKFKDFPGLNQQFASNLLLNLIGDNTMELVSAQQDFNCVDGKASSLPAHILKDAAGVDVDVDKVK